MARLAPAVLRVVAAVAVGTAVGVASQLGTGTRTASARRADCYTGLRVLRHAVSSFAEVHGRLPGPARGGDLTAANGAAMLAGQLTRPRDVAGFPSPTGPYPGLLDAVPVNPFTGSRDLVLVPEGADPVEFAAASHAGWAYVPHPSADASGPLPAGLVLPCGADVGAHSTPPARDLAFEIEDFQRWR